MGYQIMKRSSRPSEKRNDDSGTEKEAGRIREKGTGANTLQSV